MKTPSHLSTTQAAAKLGISAARVKVLIQEGRIKATPIGERSNGNPTGYVILAADCRLPKARKAGRPAKKAEKTRVKK